MKNTIRMILDQKTIAKQAALLATAQRVQTRAGMFLAAAGLIQDYVGLTQQLLTHINEITKTSIGNVESIQDGPQPGPQGNSDSPGGPAGPGVKGQPGSILG